MHRTLLPCMQHPASTNAPGTLPLDSPILQRILTKGPDPRSFISQATPTELATYGFIGEPAYFGPAVRDLNTRTNPRTSSFFTAIGQETR